MSDGYPPPLDDERQDTPRRQLVGLAFTVLGAIGFVGCAFLQSAVVGGMTLFGVAAALGLYLGRD